ncbi:MAG TPA: 50S ribosomal protein L9 [Candidatus Omnitrophota bacterium]|nr:50S ribosomal protein L9 [Candidatus Omnitrophota bacterium]HPD84306.1 50S ribosomal protein L9 [Candidatus Omnitrophota bacterium]HRZ03163.1 50S ribosomal protein L9 [Candidatus Omnitrophota bacterium]
MTIEVILLKDVQDIGKTGELVKVKDGFARNFLIPKQMACQATSANLQRIAQEKTKKAALEEKNKKQAEELAAKLAKVACSVAVEVNDLEKLYGSVSDLDIVRALELEGYSIDKKSIILEKPIEELGIYEVGIKLHPEVTAKLRLWVTKK